MIKKILRNNGSRAAIVYTCASILVKALNIITLPFYTNYLSEAEIGICSLYNTWSSVLLVVASLGLTTAAYNSGYSSWKKDKYSYTFSLIALSFLSTSVLLLIYFCKASLWNELLEMPTAIMCLMFGYFYAMPAFDFYLFMQRYEYRYKSTVIVVIAQALLSVMIGILAVIYFKNRNDVSANLGYVRLIATNSVSIVLGLAFAVYFAIKAKWSIQKKYWNYIVPISIPMIVHNVSKTILDSSDKVMIQKIVGLDAVGIYSTVYSISSLILIVWNAINASLVPFMFERLKEGTKAKDKIHAVVFPVLFGFSVMAVGFSIVAPEVIRVLTKDSYFRAAYIVPPVVAGVYLTAVYNIYTNVLVYTKKTYLVMAGTVIAAGTNIWLNYLFINKYGYIAAAYTTLVCFMLLAVLQYIFMRRTYKEDVLYSKYVLILSTSTILLCVLASNLYPFPLIRYSMIGLCFVAAVVFRKGLTRVVMKVINRET